jgi:hypothetical protein
MREILMQPVAGPRAWRGEVLTRETTWAETLGAAEIADIERALATAKASGRSLEEIDREHFPLTVTRERLARVLDEVYGGRGFVLLRGLPVERYDDDDVGLILWGLGRYLGSPLYQNPQGELLGHVYDHGRAYGQIDVRGYETNAYLPYHTDGCDLVGLLCLRKGLEGGLSSIVSSVTVHNEILARHPEYMGLLYNGFYYIRREEALGSKGVSDRPVPVFGAKDGVVSCRYIRNQINAGAVKRETPHTTLEKAALDFMDEQTRRADLRLDMDLQPGDVQLCNNYTILHSRTGFRDGPERHQQRHMLRLWLKFPQPWPVDAEFPEQFGYQRAEGPPGKPALVEA